MDGECIREYWSNEIRALLDTYKQFQVLIPAKDKNGADHNGEDGRYVEILLREYLKRYLPKDLEVLTGFVLRPAVKTGLKNKYRRGQEDVHSTQLDIIVYNSAKYPIYHRFGDSVIVPPEGVIGIISVKKHLHDTDILHELSALKKVSKLCRCENDKKIKIRGPFLALVSMDSFEKKEKCTETSVYKGYKQDKIEMRGDRAEMSDFPLYLNTVAGGLDRRDQTIGGFSFVVKIYALPVVEIIG